MSSVDKTLNIKAVLETPFEDVIQEWSEVRKVMIRKRSSEFTRDEWAYLISFLNPDSLFQNIENELHTLGETSLLKPVSKIALWLPNNVSLLGPLTSILLSLISPELKVKSGSRGKNLLATFNQWIIENTDAEKIKSWINTKVSVENFDRTDPRNTLMAKWADRRILFGGNAAAESIENLPHPIGSKGIYFTDKVSEVWIDSSSINSDNIITLGKVFAIYGQAGCTSPKRVVLVDGSKSDCQKLATLMQENWKSIRINQPEMFYASEVIMAEQVNHFNGVDCYILGQNEGIVTIIDSEPKAHPINMNLTLQTLPASEILSTQAENLQTVGYFLNDPKDEKWLRLLSRTPATRFVPCSQMHHFSMKWDGLEWWRDLFIFQSWK